MKTIKCYTCECGEDFYEDDEECCNCGRPVNQSKFVEEPLMEVISEGLVDIADMPLRPSDAIKPQNLNPCRYCGSTDLLTNLWSTDDGEIDAIECKDCMAGAPLNIWQEPDKEIRQLRQEKKDLVSTWVDEGNALHTKIRELEAQLAEKE